jgi:formate hydrogenlyase transcriptional activator
MSIRHTLLVVDDDALSLEDINSLLAPEVDVRFAQSSYEGLGLLRQEPVHVVLCGHHLTGMKGVEFLRRAQTVNPQAIRLLFAEPRDLPDVMKAVTKGDVFRAIAKPWDPAELKVIVAQAVQQYDTLVEWQRHLQDLTQERDQLRLMLEINDALVLHLELRDLFAAIAESLRRTLRHDYTSLALHDAASDTLRLHVLDFATGRGLIKEGLQIPMAEAPAARALRERKAVIFNYQELGRFGSPFVPLLLAEGVKSLCCVPLLTPVRALGTLNIGSRLDEGFTAQDAERLSQIAHPIAGAVANALAYQEIADLKDKLAEEKLYLEEEIRSDHNFEEIIGESPELQRVLHEVGIVAPTDSAVLIQGETGTGKELIARAIHDRSGRRERTFVKLNCAAIPTGLLESDLFGHEKGAFTGAIAQKIGRFELAHRGTLFLDEIGDVPLELQPKLLRVLQEQEFERLGSTRTQKVDVRLVAATNRDLTQMVADKQFRSDLYYRLNVFPIAVPPLRDRSGDIPLLVRYFTQTCGRRMGKRIENISSEDMVALCRYPWPGNVRELENFIERAVILSRGAALRLPLGELKTAAEPTAPLLQSATTTLEDAERQHILQTLRECKWVIGGPSGAAVRLGMNRTTLNSRLRKLGISRPG